LPTASNGLSDPLTPVPAPQEIADPISPRLES
jgi:hypothetical protein